MATTNHLGITKVEQAQQQKEVTVNQGLDVIDAILNTSILDRDLTTPPGSPSEGDLYIPAATATGDWAGNEGKVAHYTGGAWQFLTPAEGLTLWVADEDVLVTYDGTSWGSPNFSNVSLLGVNTTPDATNKLSVASAAVLFNNIGDNIQVKLNKNASGDSGTFLFQTGFSGRAEIGLAGNDDFTFKVSPDGSTFYESLVLDKDTGRATIKDSFLSLGAPTELEIASGAITVTKSWHTIETEGGASTDDLTTINGGEEGDIVVFMAADTNHDVVFKDGTGTAGAINLSGDFTFDSDRDTLMLIKRADGEWYLLSETSS